MVPGSANDEVNVQGSRLVHNSRLLTCIPSNGLVASGGTDLFVSGFNRYATKGAEIGIHSWEGDEGVGSELPKDHPSHKLFLDFYKDVCIPEEFYWQTLEPGLPMYWISEEEIETKFQIMRDCNDKCD